MNRTLIIGLVLFAGAIVLLRWTSDTDEIPEVGRMAGNSLDRGNRDDRGYRDRRSGRGASESGPEGVDAVRRRARRAVDSQLGGRARGDDAERPSGSQDVVRGVGERAKGGTVPGGGSRGGSGGLSQRMASGARERGNRLTASGGRSDRLETLRNRGLSDGGAVIDDGLDGDPDVAAEDEETGKLFDPFAPEVLNDEVDRGRDEDPAAVHKVDFLDDEGGIYAGEDSVLTYPAAGNINGAAGTISMVLEPDWNGSDKTSHTLLTVGEQNQWANRIRVVKNNNYLRFMYFDSEGAERGVAIAIDDWVAGERKEVTAGWDSDQLTLYVNGELVGQRPNEGELVFNNNTKIEVGSYSNKEYKGASSRIFDLLTFDKSRAPDEFR